MPLIIDDEVTDNDWHTAERSLSNDSVSVVFHLVNKLDVKIKYQMYGSSSVSDTIEQDFRLTSGHIPAGHGTAETLTNSWDTVKIRYRATTVPSSGKFVTKGMYNQN